LYSESGLEQEERLAGDKSWMVTGGRMTWRVTGCRGDWQRGPLAVAQWQGLTSIHWHFEVLRPVALGARQELRLNDPEKAKGN
jgi:hypothetical protein